MIIHYNNGKKEQLIKDVINIDVVDGEHPLNVLLKNGKELSIYLEHIESIFDEELRKKR